MLKQSIKKSFYFVALILVIALLFWGALSIVNHYDKSNLSKEDNSAINNNPVSTTTNQTTFYQDTKDQVNNKVKSIIDSKNMNQVILHTNMGDITLELSHDKPNTVANFRKLVESKFYDGVRFHRVIKGFMIQSGDPLSKDESQKPYWGTGGPGYKFNDELTGKEEYSIGTLAMANSGPNTNGSQFFIMTSNTQLPPAYTVFGKVIAGIDVAMKIQEVSTDGNDRPINDVIIESAEIK